MGSEISREDVIASKWWEAKARKMLITTTNISKVEGICSLIPFYDETNTIGLLKARPDLEKLFALHCRDQEDLSSLTDDVKAIRLWRKFRSSPGYSEVQLNWDSLLSGTACEIADIFYADICRAIFRVPFLDFVKLALGSNAFFIRSLFNTACEVRDTLQRRIIDDPSRKDIYIEVEKILEMRHLKLAHWIIASSLSKTSYPLHTTLDLMVDPVKNVFALRSLDLVLKRLSVFDQRFQQINQKYKWSDWSADLDFWDRTYQALWSTIQRIPTVNSDMLKKDMDDRSRFLASIESIRGKRGRVVLFLERFRG
ncbi:hypothetical protein LARI1_G004948 [Lachnellula arida]|uniref:Uncharacterized protein n=1 Tax=Lachnellula arida TaxID=1316785 RepID=A0A8T9BCD6_9HELO|nr:hypothetical protein LARI1_G004948 [Lachnellula arida]